MVGFGFQLSVSDYINRIFHSQEAGQKVLRALDQSVRELCASFSVHEGPASRSLPAKRSSLPVKAPHDHDAAYSFQAERQEARPRDPLRRAFTPGPRLTRLE